MILGARLLTSVVSVNFFDFTTQVEAAGGDAFDVYFQFIDKEQHTSSEGYSPSGNRYMPTPGASVVTTVLNLDGARQFSRVATQPFAQDPSIWKVSFLSTDPLDGTGSFKVVLTEGGVARTVYLQAALRIDNIREIC